MTDAVLDSGPTTALRIATPGVFLRAEGNRVVLEIGAEPPVTLDLPSPQAALLICALAGPQGLEEAALIASRDAARLHLALERLRGRVSLAWVLAERGRPIARALPLIEDFQPGPETGALDPAAHLRRAEGGDADFPVIFSCPGLGCEIRLSAEGAALAGTLLAGAQPRETDGLNRFLLRCGAGGASATRGWAFADRVMHDVTRPRDDGRSIAITPGTVGPSLPEPEWRQADPARPPAGIFAGRRSLRDFAPEPPTEEAIRRLLTQVLAFQSVRGMGAARWVERAFPAAGGLGEITGYLAVRSGEGLSPGFYRHDPLADRLDLIDSDPAALERLFDGAATAMMRPNRPPPATLILASRVDLLARKYGALAYRLALLNAGAAAATVELAAGEAGLGCCTLGTSEVRSLAALTGRADLSGITGGFEETPLLEIALGTRPARAAPGARP